MFAFGEIRREIKELKQRLLINDTMHMDTVRALGRGEDIQRLTDRVLRLEAIILAMPKSEMTMPLARSADVPADLHS